LSFEKNLENIFGNMNNLEIINGYNCHVLLDISEPLMFTLNELNQYYLAYTLQNRTALLKNGTKADVVEVLIANTTISELKMLLEGEIDIKDMFLNKNMSRIGKIGNKIFPRKDVNGIEEVENKIPKTGVRFDRTLPNKINVKKALRLIESEAKIYDSFAISEEAKFQKEVIRIELKSLNKKKNNLNLESYFNLKTFDDIRIEVKDES